MTRQINQAGLNLIKSFEGCKLAAYKDIAGIETIGYGHIAGVQPGQQITQAQADAFLLQDLTHAEGVVEHLVKSDINDNQFGALVSLVYNIGAGHLASSTLLLKLNAGDFVGAATQFLVWCNAGGKKSPGLLRRREAERVLFLS